MTYRKKLIEVALPLDAINKASAREKSIRHGHPSTLHLWWARRPLATCRAVLFASLIDDPSEHPEEFPTEQEQERERETAFQIDRSDGATGKTPTMKKYWHRYVQRFTKQPEAIPRPFLTRLLVVALFL